MRIRLERLPRTRPSRGQVGLRAQPLIPALLILTALCLVIPQLSSNSHQRGSAFGQEEAGPPLGPAAEEVTQLVPAIAQVNPPQANPPQTNPAASTTATTPAAASSKAIGGVVPKEPLEILLALGIFVYPLGVTSVIVVWFTVERLVILRRGRVIPGAFVRRFFEHLDAGNLDARTAQKLCEENRSPISQVFAHGLRKWGKPSVEVEQAVIDGGERQISLLRKHLRIINGASNVAPLLGLLGTVVGMIGSFNNVAEKASMGKTEDLAAGIGLALLTTAAGLTIAIPALIMYMYLAGRVDALVIEMDELAQDLVDRISAEGLAESARTQRPAKPV